MGLTVLQVMVDEELLNRVKLFTRQQRIEERVVVEEALKYYLVGRIPASQQEGADHIRESPRECSS